MELKFSDISQEKHEIPQPTQKYWEQKNTQTKKKKVSFDDILTNMNLVVNNTGVLQFMSPLQTTNNSENNQHTKNIQYTENSQYQQPLDTSSKHSYIYNKYFKDYINTNVAEPEVKVPKTKEEYIKMLVEERLKQIRERKRISQIKTTKLLFTTNIGNHNKQGMQGNIKASKNGLRKMSFN